MNTTTLPNKSSDLLRLALDDAAKVLGDPKYKLDMNRWHKPSKINDVCLVCLAGSVMAKTLGVEPSQQVDPTSFDTDTERKLFALNYFRVGGIKIGLLWMRINFNPNDPLLDSIASDKSITDENLRSLDTARRVMKKLIEAGL